MPIVLDMLLRLSEYLVGRLTNDRSSSLHRVRLGTANCLSCREIVESLRCHNLLFFPVVGVAHDKSQKAARRTENLQCSHPDHGVRFVRGLLYFSLPRVVRL